MAASIAEQTVPIERPPWYYRRNAWAFVLDMAFFHIGISFIGGSTVWPAFIATLTDSVVMVGVASGVWSGAWMLPQLFVASYVTRMPRKHPFVARMAWLSRPVLLVIGLVTWLYGAAAPTLALAVAIAGVFVFFVFDAIVSVPWFDLLARGLPARRRGRIQGLGQVVGGVGGIGAGMAVRYILSDGSPWRYPANYGLLFMLATLTLALSSLAISFIYEPEGPAPDPHALSVRQVLASLPRVISQDRAFLKLIVVRIVSGFVGIGSAFYVLHAMRNLGFSADSTGLFVSAQVAGSLVAGLLIGLVQDRFGPLVHIRLNIIISALAPLLALLTGALGANGTILLWLYLVIYFLMGIYMGSQGWPFFNWIMEHVQESRRPLYIGTSNTLGAVFMLAPVIGGWIVGAASYPAVFAVSAAFALVGLILSRWVPSTRRAESAHQR